jgi:outer membrane protein TolC
VLQLQDVLDSVERNYPPLLAALADMEIAEAEQIIAEGRFDVRLQAGFDSNRLGFYSNEKFGVGVEQRFRSMGGSIGGGWRRGEGSFPSYEGELLTRSGGEYRTGLRLPLLRDRAIDSERANLRKAGIQRTIARLTVDQQRLIITQLATRRYWDWVAAGLRRRVATSLLQVATERDEFLREAVRLGQLPAIEVMDNMRAILNRRSELVTAERLLQQAAINLSLFVRDGNGDPILPPPETLPADFPSPEPVNEQALLQRVEDGLRLRPEIDRLEAEIERALVDEKLARSDTLPNVDLGLGLTTERGVGPVLRGPSQFKASLMFELPFQRRDAKGRMYRAQAAVRQLEQRRRFAMDQVRAEIREAVVALAAAHERAMLLRQELETARNLEEAERTRFQLGEGNLFLVNLREVATADTAVRHVNALFEYFAAKAQYEYAAAQLLAGPP